MNPWLSFLLGGATSCLMIGGFSGWVLSWIANDPKLSLAAVAAVLRGFASRVSDLHVVVTVRGEKVFVPFEQIARAVENAHCVADVRDGMDVCQDRQKGLDS